MASPENTQVRKAISAMAHSDIFSAAPPENIVLPQLEAIRSHPLSQIRHVIRDEQICAVTAIVQVNISARIKQPLLHLDNGESVVVTCRAKVNRLDGADGVLQLQGDGGYRWLSHRLIDIFEANVEARGLPALAAEIIKSWDNNFRFKMERPSADGFVEAGIVRATRKPPLLGASRVMESKMPGNVAKHGVASHQVHSEYKVASMDKRIVLETMDRRASPGRPIPGSHK